MAGQKTFLLKMNGATSQLVALPEPKSHQERDAPLAPKLDTDYNSRQTLRAAADPSATTCPAGCVHRCPPRAKSTCFRPRSRSSYHISGEGWLGALEEKRTFLRRNADADHRRDVALQLPIFARFWRGWLWVARPGGRKEPGGCDRAARRA